MTIVELDLSIYMKLCGTFNVAWFYLDDLTLASTLPKFSIIFLDLAIGAECSKAVFYDLI